MWNFVVTFLNEGYIVIALSCFMQYRYLSFSTSGKAFSSVFALISGPILLISPLINLFIVLKNRHRLKEASFKDKYGSIYEKLNIKRSI